MDARPAQPTVGPGRLALTRGAVWGAAGVLLALAILYWFDPTRHGFYPRCGFRALTGWDCPGCGGLRGLHELLHGRVAAAWGLNPLVPLLAIAGSLWLALRRREGPLVNWLRRRGPALIVLALIVFGILRNVWPPLSTAP